MNRRHPDGDATWPVLGWFDEPRAPEQTTVALVADVHLSPDAHGTWKLFHRTEQFLKTVVKDVRAGPADAVVFAGDLTKDGTQAAYDRFDDLVSPLSAPWCAVPGNHDVPKRRNDSPGLGADSFAGRYAGGSFPWVLEAGNVSLIGLNSATVPDGRLQDTWRGAVSSAQLDALDDVLADAEAAVVVVHHNCARLHENAETHPWSAFRLENAHALRAVCTRHDVGLLVSAHHHVPAVCDGTETPELLLPAVCSFPNAYVRLTVSEQGTVARLVPLATPEELEEAYAAVRSGSPLGRGILSLVERRFGVR